MMENIDLKAFFENTKKEDINKFKEEGFLNKYIYMCKFSAMRENSYRPEEIGLIKIIANKKIETMQEDKTLEYKFLKIRPEFTKCTLISKILTHIEKVT